MKKVFSIILLLFTFISFDSFSQKKQKVIFDCDLGDDIDDAYALALLLASPDVELVGITTCYGRTNDRAKVALKMLYDCGLEKIPVALGRNTSAMNARANEYMGQFYWAKSFDKIKPIQQSAVDFIIEKLKANPNEITVISVGPVQNMADLIDKDPSVLKLAKQVYAMFGSFNIGYNGSPTPDREWNVVVDIAASKKFVDSGVKIKYFGLDVTTFVKADVAFRERLLYRQSPLTNALCGLQQVWSYQSTPTLFDAVAVGGLLWPDLFKSKTASIKVDDAGYTVFDTNVTNNAEIVSYINTNEFLKRLMDTYMKQDLGR